MRAPKIERYGEADTSREGIPLIPTEIEVQRWGKISLVGQISTPADYGSSPVLNKDLI